MVPWIKFVSLYRKFNYPIEFYGIIVDQDGKPIPSVQVSAQIRGKNVIGGPIPDPFAISRRVYRKTDKDGLFKIKGYYGGHLTFWTNDGAFRKDGYEFVYNSEVSTSFFSYQLAKPDPNNPFVYRMRKLEETTYLLEKKYSDRRVGLSAGTSGHIKYYDIIKNIAFNSERTMDNAKRPLTRDLQISAKWEESNNRWAVTFAAGTENGGIQIQNKKLYTAPEEGYKPEVTFYRYIDRPKFICLKESPDEPFEPAFNPPYGPNSDFGLYYFYLKSRECELYSRFTMEMPSITPEGRIHFAADVAVNPFSGQRSLEMEPKIPMSLRLALDKEIREAFKKDPNARIPPPPKNMDKIMYSQLPRIIAERAEEIARMGNK